MVPIADPIYRVPRTREFAQATQDNLSELSEDLFGVIQTGNQEGEVIVHATILARYSALFNTIHTRLPWDYYLVKIAVSYGTDRHTRPSGFAHSAKNWDTHD